MVDGGSRRASQHHPPRGLTRPHVPRPTRLAKERCVCPTPTPSPTPRQHGPPAAPQHGRLLAATLLGLLWPGPLLAAVAALTDSPALTALAGRLCRLALELCAVVLAAAALTTPRGR